MRQSTHSNRNRRSARRRALKRRKGSILVLAAILMIVMLSMLAMSIDTGYMYTMQAQLDRSVDAAALAGAAGLIDGTDHANVSVIEYLVRNPVGQPTSILTDDDLARLTAEFLAEHGDDYEIRWGNWNGDTEQFEQTTALPSAISVSMTYPNLPFFFGRALGKESFAVQSHAIAMYQPRDIMVVLDLSGSMNDDSELKSISQFGEEAIMAGLQQMWEELGSPSYGNMPFTPGYATAVGVPPADKKLPQVTVEYRGTSVYITSTKDISNVMLQLADNSTVRNESYGDGTLETTFSANQRIVKVWVKSGTNASFFENTNGMGELFDFSLNSTFVDALELSDVPYPYSSGNWSDYVDYVRTSSTIANAGQKYKFGHANLINYWLERKPSYSQTSDLWRVSAQPVTAVKDAVDVFMDYVTQVETNDRIGLAIYDAPDGEGKLETGLTNDFDYVVELARERQAGHYHNYTNIGAGMEAAREELEAHGRNGAFKMIVLMTDGRANWHSGRYDTSAAWNHVISESHAAKAKNIPVVAISLGAGADVDLMDAVAEISESRHFNVPGGQSVLDYREDLFEVFRAIADSRPLKLVK